MKVDFPSASDGDVELVAKPDAMILVPSAAAFRRKRKVRGLRHGD
jgi:hypothetical protein